MWQKAQLLPGVKRSQRCVADFTVFYLTGRDHFMSFLLFSFSTHNTKMTCVCVESNFVFAQPHHTHGLNHLVWVSTGPSCRDVQVVLKPPKGTGKLLLSNLKLHNSITCLPGGKQAAAIYSTTLLLLLLLLTCQVVGSKIIQYTYCYNNMLTPLRTKQTWWPCNRSTKQ